MLIAHPPTPRSPDEIDPNSSSARTSSSCLPRRLKSCCPQSPVARRRPDPGPRSHTPGAREASASASARRPGSGARRQPSRARIISRRCPRASGSPRSCPHSRADTRSRPDREERSASRGRPDARVSRRPGAAGTNAFGRGGPEPLVGPIGPSIANAVDSLTQAHAARFTRGTSHGNRPEPGGAPVRPAGRRLHALDQSLQGRGLQELVVLLVGAVGAAREHGGLDFEFTVDRNGSISALRMLEVLGKHPRSTARRSSRSAVAGSCLCPTTTARRG